ncbi:MAG: ComEA family DNA-binding protein [Fastidiosipila sp.]|nr:ComEA family DNA-binding protein [Fastidiosipila sp.]
MADQVLLSGGKSVRGRTGPYPTLNSRSGRPKRAPLFFFFALIALSAVILILIARKPSGQPVLIVSGETEGLQTEAARPTLFPVHVDGAVKNPGLYYFAESSIMEDAIKQAGGLSPLADCGAVNLAMLLRPHMKIYVPREGEDVAWLPLGEDEPEAEALIDLNRASQRELETLPGVGQATAEAILAFREENGPFSDIEELMQVPGIKEGRFSKLKDRVTVTGP